MIDADRLSSYLERLPAFLQEEDVHSLGRMLLAFEHVLSGLGDIDDPGLEEVLDGTADPDSGRELAGIERYFDPGMRAGGSFAPPEQRAPAEFLDWLASWVGVTLRNDMPDSQRREAIARAVQLYRKRGTREGLEQLVAIQSALHATITDAGTPPRPGAPDLSDAAPHTFHVRVSLPSGSIEAIARQRALVEDILDAEKPAHTTYDLDVVTPQLQIGKASTIGVDTLIGKPDYR